MTTRAPEDSLLRVVTTALHDAGIPFMLTGSLASAFHGAGRATMDIDLVIDPTIDQLRGFVDALRPDRFYASLDAALEARRNESLFNVVDAESGWKVDLIVRKSRPFNRVEFERRVRVEFEGLPLAVATVEDVIISKLEWARLGASARQLEDVAALLRVRHRDLEQEYVARWIGELGLEEQWRAARKLAAVV